VANLAQLETAIRNLKPEQGLPLIVHTPGGQTGVIQMGNAKPHPPSP